MARKLIKPRRDDTCSICGRPILAGVEAYWQTPERVIICRECADELPGTQQAGGSAQAEYDRRVDRRRAHAEERFGSLGRWASGRSNGPQHERAWARGAAGDTENARRLEKRLADTPCVLLDDRRVPGRRANIDHIAIGPNGAVVIDSKNMSGEIRIRSQGGLLSARRVDLYINGRRRTDFVEKVEHQVEVVRLALVSEGLDSIPVRGALCMANPAGLPLLARLALREVVIDGTRRIAELVAEDGPLDAEANRHAARALDRRLPRA